MNNKKANIFCCYCAAAVNDFLSRRQSTIPWLSSRVTPRHFVWLELSEGIPEQRSQGNRCPVIRRNIRCPAVHWNNQIGKIVLRTTAKSNLTTTEMTRIDGENCCLMFNNVNSFFFIFIFYSSLVVKAQQSSHFVIKKLFLVVLLKLIFLLNCKVRQTFHIFLLLYPNFKLNIPFFTNGEKDLSFQVL